MQKKACFSVTDYGAVPNQEDYQDAYIQQALDACFLAGGGEVIIPTGTYRVRGCACAPIPHCTCWKTVF